MKIGLSLSGGGSRGIAHLGVLKALEEMGVKPSIISGVSAGAIIGAYYSNQYSPNQILEIFLEKKFKNYFRFHYGGLGIIDMKKIHKYFLKYFPEDNFNELSIPLVICATDIITSETVYFTEGPLIMPILASSAIPFLFSPIQFNDTLLLDGGILNNMPVDPLLGKCDKIIGVHVNHQDNLLRNKSRIGILERVFHLSTERSVKQNAKKCDCFIDPPEMANYSMFSISKAPEVFKIGYNYTISIRKKIEKALEN